MTVPVLLVAEDLATQLGDPTIEALSQRWSSSAACDVCDEPIAAHPATIIGRSTLESTEFVHLRPAHGHCSPSKWIKNASTDDLLGRSVRAELIAVLLSAATTSSHLDTSVRRPLVILVINPTVSAARYRIIRAGEAVDLDMLSLAGSGWTVLADTTLGDPIAPLVVSELGPNWLSVTLPAGTVWRLPSSPALERAVRLRRGLLVALGHRPPVAQISDAGPNAAELLVPAMEHGDLLSSWARLR